MEHVRVSTILQWLFPYDGIDPEVLKAKADIGTNVHKSIVDYCNSEFYVNQTDRAEAYFQSWLMWRKDNTCAIDQIPRLKCNELMITGECDGLYMSCLPMLIDWKCSASANIDAWTMQAHFYAYLLKQAGYDLEPTMKWVQLTHTKKVKDGFYFYVPGKPVVHSIQYSQAMMQYCIAKAQEYHEIKSLASILD